MWSAAGVVLCFALVTAHEAFVSQPCFANGLSGVCANRNVTKTCPGEWALGICPGGEGIDCCLSTTLADPNSLVSAFADANWNCADVACTQTVPAGSAQPNYECAEFVSRSLAAGGYIPGLQPKDAQSAYGSYSYKGITYDLLWVSSKQGPPLGLQDFLEVLGWSQVSSVDAATVAFVTGSEGPYHHVVVGVSPGTLDAHNMARYHVPTSFYTVNSLYAASSTPTGKLVDIDDVPVGSEEWHDDSAASEKDETKPDELRKSDFEKLMMP